MKSQQIKPLVLLFVNNEYICYMIRTILKSDQNNLTISLPDDLVGKLIEVIAFEIEDGKNSDSIITLKPSQLRGFLSEKSSKLMHDHVNQSRAEWDTL